MDNHLHDQLNDYVKTLYAPETDTLRNINEEAARNGLPEIHLQPFEGRLLQLLMSAIDARKVVEIGTLAGYSGAWLANALPADGKLYTLEKSSKHARIARENFARLGLEGKVEVIEGDALSSLRLLAARTPFDMVFIDADKSSYIDYFNWAAEHLRPGGIIAAHNAYRHGRVIAPESADDRAVDNFNRALAAHPGFDSLIIGIGDGMAVGVKKRG